jgi:hypothetical protein
MAHQALSVILAGAAGSCKTSMALSAGQMFLWLGNSGAITDLAQTQLGFTPFCWPPTLLEFGGTEDERKKRMNSMLTVQGTRTDSQFYVDRWWWSLATAVKENKWARPALLNRMIDAKVYRVIENAEGLKNILELLRDLDALSFVPSHIGTRAFAGLGIDDVSLLIGYEVAAMATSKTDFISEKSGKKDLMQMYGHEGHLATMLMNMIDRGIGSGVPVFMTGHLTPPKTDKAIPGDKFNRAPYGEDERRSPEDRGGLKLSSSTKCATAAECSHATFIVLKNDNPVNPDPWAEPDKNPMNVSLRVLPNDGMYHGKSRFGHYGSDMPPSLEAQWQADTLRELLPRYKCGKVDLNWQYDLAYEIRDALVAAPDFAEFANFNKRFTAAQQVANTVLAPWAAKLQSAGHDENLAFLWLRNAEQIGRAMADIALRSAQKKQSIGIKLFGGAQRPA